MLCLFRELGQVVGLAEVGAAAVADLIVEPVEDGRLADSSNIFIRVNKIMK
jgi:hypothetical protein